ncbi:MAG: KUP/HAK/KT family potassium transporter, partial [Terricaulis sp.]
ASNLTKIFHGGLVPLIIAAGFIIIMWTWVRGSSLLHEQTRRDVSLQQMLATLEISPPKRVRGTAIFLTADPHAAPTALMHNLKHNQVLHERIILLSVKTAPTLVPTDKSGMPRWQDLLFIFLARNSSSATEFFHIPTSRVVELGTQVAV